MFENNRIIRHIKRKANICNFLKFMDYGEWEFL